MMAIHSITLGASTIARRVESLSKDIFQQGQQDLNDCNCYPLQFDESLDISP
ncbi:hypothetical protein KIL84_011537, partial [Mauremys mutica]